MKYSIFTISALALTLGSLPTWAQDSAPSVQTETPDQNSEQPGENTKPNRSVMFGQFNAIRAQLKLSPIEKQQLEETNALIVEAQTVLGADATVQDIRTFFEARSAGYETVAEMQADVEALLGPMASEGAVKAYLMLRRAERYGMAGRETDYDALRTEIAALEKIDPGKLRMLLRARHQSEASEPVEPENTGRNNVRVNTDVRNRIEIQREKAEENREDAKAELEARSEEIKARLEARLSALEAQQENMKAEAEARYAEAEAKLEAKIEVLNEKREQNQATADARYQETKAELETRLKAIEAQREAIKAEAHTQAETGIQMDLLNNRREQHKKDKE